MEAALPVDVRAIEPGTTVGEPRQSRHARLAVDGGPVVRVYDPRAVVTPDAVGSRRVVELVAVVGTVTVVDDRTTGVEAGEGKTPQFRGLVVAVDEDGEEALLDVGTGTVRFDTVTADERVHVGDFIRLTDAVVHLSGMTPEGQSNAAFFAQLEADSPADRRVAARYLGHLGDERAVDPLVDCYRRETDPTVREAVVAALGRLAVLARRPNEAPNPRVRSTLEAATGDEAAEVRAAADTWLTRVNNYWDSW